MCKRNSPQKSNASMGCVRETPQIEIKPVRDVQEKLPAIKKKKKKKKNEHGMCKRNSPDKNKAKTKFLATLKKERKKASMGCVRETPHTKSKHGMCKRNSADKNKASMGCVREPHPHPP